MKKFIKKCTVLFLITALMMGIVCFTDTFNIFHYADLRITSSESNKNYIKTKYIISHPQKFNSFIFGSSRAERIPPDSLPQSSDGTKLSWFNMSYSLGTPREHLGNLKTFLKNGVDVKYVFIGVDNVSSSENSSGHDSELLRKPYELSVDDPLGYYWSYLWNMADIKSLNKLLPQVLDNYTESSVYAGQKYLFYSWGSCYTDITIPGTVKESKFMNAPHWYYKNKEVISDIRDIVSLCKENDIRLVFFTSPILGSVYQDSVYNGEYFDFLKDLASVTEFYNFSGLNAYTTDRKYYSDLSHYRPYVGNEIEKMIWGSSKEKEAAAAKAANGMSDDTCFGMKTDSSNVDQLIGKLKKQLAE